jgi:hypothetical protein
MPCRLQYRTSGYCLIYCIEAQKAEFYYPASKTYNESPIIWNYISIPLSHPTPPPSPLKLLYITSYYYAAPCLFDIFTPWWWKTCTEAWRGCKRCVFWVSRECLLLSWVESISVWMVKECLLLSWVESLSVCWWFIRECLVFTWVESLSIWVIRECLLFTWVECVSIWVLMKCHLFTWVESVSIWVFMEWLLLSWVESLYIWVIRECLLFT